MLFTSRTIIGALAAVLIAAPAIAQTPAPPPAGPNDLSEEQQAELYCAYDAMYEDKDVLDVQLWVIAGDTAKEKSATAVFDRSTAACASKHQWNSDQKALGGIIARSAILTDMVEAELRHLGFDDKMLETVMKVEAKLSDDDSDAMIDMGYGKKGDEKLLGRVKALLFAAGLPKNDEAGDLAFTFLQASLHEYDAATVWIDKKLY